MVERGQENVWIQEARIEIKIKDSNKDRQIKVGTAHTKNEEPERKETLAFSTFEVGAVQRGKAVWDAKIVVGMLRSSTLGV